MESANSLSDARVDAAWIASHIDDSSVRCVEVDVSPSAYNAGHIPGAVLWNAYTDLRHSDYRPFDALAGDDTKARSSLDQLSGEVFRTQTARENVATALGKGAANERTMDLATLADQFV